MTPNMAPTPANQANTLTSAMRPIMRPCNQAKKDPAATIPMADCHAGAKLPTMGPAVPNPKASKLRSQVTQPTKPATAPSMA